MMYYRVTAYSSSCIIYVALLSSAFNIRRTLTMSSFPEDFLFGISTSSYQVEGAWNESDKGENIWDRLTHTRVPAMDTGDVACDSYRLYEQDIALVKDIGVRSSDFLAINYYTTILSTSESPINKSFKLQNHDEDSDVLQYMNPDWPVGHASWLAIYPKGLENTLQYIKDRYGNPPVFITENGFATDNILNDTERISYHKVHLVALSEAINKHGCQVFGYLVWSLLDNFEWMFGYAHRFGLVHVDFNDPLRKRTPKSSTEFFKKLLNTRPVQLT